MSLTFVDFYAFRSRCEQHMQVVEALRLGMGGHGSLLKLSPQPGGWQGYKSHGLLDFGGVQVGLVAWGGEHQLGWVHSSLSGSGCEFVQSWDFFEAATQSLPEFSYRRVDLARDVTDGSCSHEKTIEAYRAGGFDSHGHRPKGSRREPEDRSHGSTFYAGNRKSWKYARCYDKGCQLRAKLGMTGLTHINGVRVEDIYRLEVELKAKDGVVLPLDLVRNRDHYFAGAYPYFADVLQGVEGRRLTMGRKFTVHADLTRGLATCQRMFGPLLRAALQVHDGNVHAVWDQIVGERITDRWIAAGALHKGDWR